MAPVDLFPDVAIMGVPDCERRERLRAFVVSWPSVALTPEGVTSFCEGRISPSKTPKEVVFIDQIPHDANGENHHGTAAARTTHYPSQPGSINRQSARGHAVAAAIRPPTQQPPAGRALPRPLP